MSRITKTLMIAGLLLAGFAATSLVGVSTAQAGGYGYGYGYRSYYRSYTPVYRHRSYYAPNYHCAPSYGYGYGGFGY